MGPLCSGPSTPAHTANSRAPPRARSRHSLGAAHVPAAPAPASALQHASSCTAGFRTRSTFMLAPLWPSQRRLRRSAPRPSVHTPTQPRTPARASGARLLSLHALQSSACAPRSAHRPTCLCAVATWASLHPSPTPVLRRAPAPTWRRAPAPARAHLGRVDHPRRQAAAAPTPAAAPRAPARPRAACARVGPLTRAPHGCASSRSAAPHGPASRAARFRSAARRSAPHTTTQAAAARSGHSAPEPRQRSAVACPRAHPRAVGASLVGGEREGKMELNRAAAMGRR
jgi:hypothetical protein